MATTTATPKSVRAWLFRPQVLGMLALAYVVIATFLLVKQDRSSLWFPLANVCLLPLFLLSPFVIISAPLSSRVKLISIVGLLVILMPLVGMFNTSYLELAIQICLFAGLALGLNIVVGFAGLLDLGYVAFFAVGAYMWGALTSSAPTVFNINGWLLPGWAFYAVILVGVFVAALIGILLGLPVLRLRGDYLAIVTLGFGEVIRVLARNADSPINFTNGSQGLHNIGKPPLPGFAGEFTAGIAAALGIRMDNPPVVAQQLLFYFIAVLVLVIVIIVSRRLQDSPIGRAWAAIREDEVAAIAMGVPLVRMKLLAFAMGASFAGAIGVIYASKQTFIDPTSFVLLQSITILAMVIVGGMGSIRGVILGAVIIVLLDLHILTNLSLQLNALKNVDFVVPIFNLHIRDIPAQLEPAKYQPFVFGLILVLMMLFRPAGLLPEARRKLELQKREDPLEEDPEIVAESIEVGD
jgi:branched-chain amino acid transport system permease protein